jgi:hypothetical protein
MSLHHTFCSNVATKYLIEWRSFFAVIVQPAGKNKTLSLFHTYQNKMYTELTNTDRTCQQYWHLNLCHSHNSVDIHLHSSNRHHFTFSAAAARYNVHALPGTAKEAFCCYILHYYFCTAQWYHKDKYLNV